MPIGPYKDFDACVASVSRRKNPPSDPKAYCGWLQKRIEGGNLEFINDEEALLQAYYQHLVDNPDLEADNSALKLMNKEDAKRILNAPGDLKEWADVQLIDDHRWCHLWEKTLQRGDKLFLTKDELRKLHDYLVAEMKKRGMDAGGGASGHKTPIDLGGILFSKQVSLRHRRQINLLESSLSSPVKTQDPILLDSEFISIVGEGVTKDSPENLQIMMKCPPNEQFQEALFKALPEAVKDRVDFVFGDGPNGPYIPAYALYAVPIKSLSVKEPKFDVTPLSPNLPAAPSKLLEDPKDLSEDSYFVEAISGTRTMVHRKGSLVIAFDNELKEMELPEDMVAELKSIELSDTFILDGFLEDGVYRMIDLIWRQESQHVNESAEARRKLLAEMPETEHVKRSAGVHLKTKAATLEYLKGKNGPLLLIPGATPYPKEGRAAWLLFAPKKAAYLVNARLGFESPIVSESSPWIALQSTPRTEKEKAQAQGIPRTEEERAKAHFGITDKQWEKLSDEEKKAFVKKLPPRGQKAGEWVYLQNNETVWTQLSELGIGRLIGTECQDEVRLEAEKHGIVYELTTSPTIKQFIHGPPAVQKDLASIEVIPEDFKRFYDLIRPMPHEVMKLSCGGAVPLNRLRLQKGLYNRSPVESDYSIQFHVRDMNVYADLRYQVGSSQAIGWTLNLGESLIKPLLKRTPEALREQAGISLGDLKLSVKELTTKLNSTEFGRKLGKAFVKKLGSLERPLVKTMLKELWVKDVAPRLASGQGVFAQRKYPTTPDWLNYEAVPAGAVGATNEVVGTMYLMDVGKIKFGTQDHNLHEYWLDGKNLKSTRMLVRKFSANKQWGAKESYGWFASFSKKLDAGLQFTVKKAAQNHWLLVHDDKDIHQAWDFGKNNNPIKEGGLPVHLSDASEQLLKLSTIDTGNVTVVQDSNYLAQMEFAGAHLKGNYVLIKDGETWSFGPASISEKQKALLLSSYPELYDAACPLQSCSTPASRNGVIHLAASDDMEFEQVGDLLFIRGPAIKPGEVLPMDGRPSFFTKEGIKKFWPSMYRQPIVVLHGDLKGDVIGFVSRNWFDEATGWGWVEGIIWHPQGIKLIVEKKLPAFSIEVIPKSVWDAEHKHEHVIGGRCVGLAVVPKGACVTCTPTEATMGAITVEKGKVYKYGMTTEQYLSEQYWAQGKSTAEIAKLMHKPRSTVENWMTQADIPRRNLTEARALRTRREEITRKFGGRAFITSLGRGATLFTIGEEHLLINAPEGIATMLGFKKLKPKCVLIENLNYAAGIEELGALNPAIMATEKTWNDIKAIYPDFSYKGKQLVIPPNKLVKMGSYLMKAFAVGASTAYKVEAAGSVIVHATTVPMELPSELLQQVDIYIGDGATLNEDKDGHLSMVKQTLQAKEAEVLKILFPTHGEQEELGDALHKVAANAFLIEAGAELQLSPGNPGAFFSLEEAEGIAAQGHVVVRAKPYQEYAKQAIYLLGDNKILGLYVEGFPEGPIPIEKAKEMKHGLSDKTWAERFENVDQVWVYQPRMLKTFEQLREFRVPEYTAGPYIPHVKTV